ncbi:MAG: hypothetical protein K8R45_06885, partial [Desulfobacterales bacterium]|nr:hypothetical protein [Desulfobacterales bacterium]
MAGKCPQLEGGVYTTGDGNKGNLSSNLRKHKYTKNIHFAYAHFLFLKNSMIPFGIKIITPINKQPYIIRASSAFTKVERP